MDGLSEITLEDFSSVCRICLNKEDLVALNHKHLNIMKKIIKIEMEIDDEDLFPSNICKRCTAKLEDISSFIMLSESSHALFKQLLQDSKPDLALVKLEEVPEIGNFSESEPEGAEEIRNVLEKKDSQPLKKSNCRKWLPTICKICSQSFSSKKKFIAHTRVNPKCVVKDHKCNVCDKSFLTEFKLKYHMRSHSDETPFKCKICSKTFRYAPNLRRHDNIIHKGMKPFKCEVCGKEFSRLLTKTEHMSKHTGRQPFSCQYCKANFHYYCQYFAHSYLHRIYRGEVNNPTFKVAECDNSKILSVECTTCFKKISPSAVFQHVHYGENKRKVKLPTQKDFLCTICGKSFLRKIQLTSHSVVHTDLKSYACDKCDKRFRHYSSLKTHLLIHAGVKPFNCEVCECSFSQRQHLKQHVKIHTGEKPFVCSYCGKQFAANSNLTVHKRIHTGETPFKCPICDKGYCDSTSLKKHIKSHHKAKNEPFEPKTETI